MGAEFIGNKHTHKFTHSLTYTHTALYISAYGPTMWRKMSDDICSRLDKIPQRDGRMDRHDRNRTE